MTGRAVLAIFILSSMVAQAEALEPENAADPVDPAERPSGQEDPNNAR